MKANRLARLFLAVIAVLSVVLVWSLAGSDQSGIESGDSANFSDAGQDYAEVFSAGSNGIIYINFQEPQATNDFFRAAWFLGAYKFADGSLIVELSAEGGSASGGERGGVLTNNLRYALSYAAGTGAESAIYLSLLTTNGVALAESEDLLTSSNVDHYVFLVSDAGNLATNTVLLVNVPTAEYPDAAVIQLIATDDGTVPIIVGKSALYIDEDGDGWTATTEIRNETSDYIFDASGGVISNYDDWVNGGGSSTNNTGGGGGSGGDENQGGGNNGGTIYVNQAIGDDNLTGYAPTVAGREGPKKTIHRGLAAVDSDGAHTLVINSGHYGEDLDLRSRRVTVVIEGNVKL